MSIKLCWAFCGCLLLLMGSAIQGAPEQKKSAFRPYAVRYQIQDLDRAIAFYARLGFHLDQRQGPVFATVSNGDLHLLLSGPGSSGSRVMPDGRKQEPGGWNRVVLEVDDLASLAEQMKKEGFHFRNAIETGPGGKQILLDDPDGNPIELHQPPS